MPPFSRLAIKPSAEFIYKFAIRTFASWIPTGYRWFERSALNSDQELGREIHAWSKVAADLRTAIEIQRWEVLIPTEDHDQLIAFGKLVNMAPIDGEDDQTF